MPSSWTQGEQVERLNVLIDDKTAVIEALEAQIKKLEEAAADNAQELTRLHGELATATGELEELQPIFRLRCDSAQPRLRSIGGLGSRIEDRGSRI